MGGGQRAGRTNTNGEQFQEIFVINLPERTDRRDAMTLAAAVTDLSLTFIPGVRGADVQQKVLPPSERSKNENWTGKTGSWRAHMNVLQRCVSLLPPPPLPKSPSEINTVTGKAEPGR